MHRATMQQEECSAPQDNTETPNESTRDKHITVNRLAVPIDITGQCLKMVRVFSFCWFLNRMPEVRGPTGKQIGEAFGTISTGQL